MPLKRLLIMLLAVLSASVATARADICRTNAAICHPGPCNWSDAVSWTDCAGSGIPQSPTDKVFISDHHAVVYDTTGLTVGTVTLFGNLRFDESSSERGPDGFRTLTIRAGGGESLVLSGAGALQLRKGDRLRFDTATDTGRILLTDGALLDLRGDVHVTTIASVADAPATTANCGPSQTGAGRFWTVTPASGGPFSRATHRGRRVVFRSGKARNRHLEIWSLPGGDPGPNLGLCTGLDDRDSLGQRITPHASGIGALPISRHATPTITDASSPYYALPEVGDEIAIVQDVWVEETGGTNGYYITATSNGVDPFPILQAVNFGGMGAPGRVAFMMSAKTEAQIVYDFVYNNVHDNQGSSTFNYQGAQNYDVKWNAFHDAAPGAEPGAMFLAKYARTILPKGLDISDNICYRFAEICVKYNDSGSTRSSRGVLFQRNLMFDGCAQSAPACTAFQIHNCRSCDISHNVAYDICAAGPYTGVAIRVLGSDTCEGTASHDNWIVNTCATGIAMFNTNQAQKATAVHNYISHSRHKGGSGGAWYSNVIKNVGLEGNNTINHSLLFNPIVAKGNFLIGNDSTTAGSPDCAVNGCARYGMYLTSLAGAGNTNNAPTFFSDNVITGLTNRNQPAYIFLEGSTIGVNFDVTAVHNTLDGRGVSADGFWIAISDPPDSPIEIVANDLVATHLAGNEGATCTPAGANVTDNIGLLYLTDGALPAEDAAPTANAMSCSSGPIEVFVASPGYLGRENGDYNLAEEAPQRTAGSDPPGSPVGVRAFRFDRSNLSALWGGNLPFEGEFPANIANVDNIDTDGDGVIDLHDVCEYVPNAGQLGTGLAQGPEICDNIDNDCNGLVDDIDADGDGFSVCASDCDDDNPAINPGAAEICNGLDDDCDTLIDEDASGDDSDGDSVANLCDNCVLDFNPDQVNTDVDGLGDACDNCPTVSNEGQADANGDDIGDLCDDPAVNANADDTGSSQGRIDGSDLFLIARAFAACRGEPSFRPSVDLNRDSCIDGIDLALMASVWGQRIP